MSPQVIGTRIFLDGVEREVYLDAHGSQFVIGPDGEHVYGVWLLTPEVLEDTPAVIMAPRVCERCGR